MGDENDTGFDGVAKTAEIIRNLMWALAVLGTLMIALATYVSMNTAASPEAQVPPGMK